MVRSTKEVKVDGVGMVALIDSGSDVNLIMTRLVKGVINRTNGFVNGVGGQTLKTCGSCSLEVEVVEGVLVLMKFLVVEELVNDVEMIIGIDGIGLAGGIVIDECGTVSWKRGPNVNVVRNGKQIEIEDEDFNAKFVNGRWLVRWKWKDGKPTLRNCVAEYRISAAIRSKYRNELQLWKKNGWLKRSSNNSKSGIIPLLAVHQEAKGKVRPVLDYREMNQYVRSHNKDTVSIDDTIRRWRTMSPNCTLLDLKNAYLQLHVSDEMSAYQRVRIDDQYYNLTRLGFGLTSAPKIMSAVLEKVLSLNEKIRKGTSHYVDDILVDEEVVTSAVVRKHLLEYGLICKDPEKLSEAKVLGLQIGDNDGELYWKRGGKLPSINDEMKREDVYSMCGKLTCHYPVARWLRVACSFIKRSCNGLEWKDAVPTKAVEMLSEVVRRVQTDDPIKGKWNIKDGDDVTVWCDASQVAVGCAIQVGDSIVEDGSWLRKLNDSAHINVAELDSVLKGINMAVKWNFKKMKIVTDSKVVFGWLNLVKSRSYRVKVTGLSELDVDWSCEWVTSQTNKADELTRVPKRWLETTCAIRQQNDSNDVAQMIRQIHDKNHFGVDKTLYFANKAEIVTSREAVKQVIKGCQRCNSIDPAPRRLKVGKLSVDENWKKLAIDHTHVKNNVYLTVIDCGPSRFAIWRKVRSQSAEETAFNCQQIMYEHGIPDEVLVDNGGAFSGGDFSKMCQELGVRIIYRCAHRPSTNGIIERSHRTIKRSAARSQTCILKAVYWYNISPKAKGEESSVPVNVLRNREWRIPDSVVKMNDGVTDGLFSVGDTVFVKPSQHVKCDDEWKRGTVTNELGGCVYEVDGLARHAQDIRRCCEDGQGLGETSESMNLDSDDDNEEYSDVASDVSEDAIPFDRGRVRTAPAWHADYMMY